MTRKPKDPANIIVQILSATMDDDGERGEKLVDALYEQTTHQQRVGLYRANVALYAVADEFGMATETPESAFERLQEEAADDDALQGLVCKVGLFEALMDEVLTELDARPRRRWRPLACLPKARDRSDRGGNCVRGWHRRTRFERVAGRSPPPLPRHCPPGFLAGRRGVTA